MVVLRRPENHWGEQLLEYITLDLELVADTLQGTGLPEITEETAWVGREVYKRMELWKLCFESVVCPFATAKVSKSAMEARTDDMICSKILTMVFNKVNALDAKEDIFNTESMKKLGLC